MTSLKIFNAPAGSGKSTEIKARVSEWSDRYPQDRMLCVTYTNRAADELQSGISAKNVDVSTIHSFLAEFMKPMFISPAVVDLFLDIHRDDIEARIANVEQKVHVEESNARYREKLGEPLTYELIASSITELRYNEMQSNSLFSGGLSHEGLLSFANACALKFPGLLKRISSKYQQIIIDEYQDTSIEILEFFVAAVQDSKTSLHLYGDPMQQIYQVTSDRLRAILSKFQIDDRTVTNYRSSRAIVDALNKIYNDPSVVQKPKDPSESESPRVHLTVSPDNLREKLVAPETLVLSVRNATIFDHIGAKELLNAVQAMPAHSYSSRYPATGVLTETRWLEVKNPLIQLLYGFIHLEHAYRDGKIGESIQLLKKHSSTFGFAPVENHVDKERLRSELDDVFDFLDSDTVTIQQVLSHLTSRGCMKATTAAEYLENEDYSSLLAVPFVQVRRMYTFNLKPGWSTQHGVKGESHEKVVFLAEDSNRTPYVHVTKLFNLWTEVSFSLASLEETYVRVADVYQRARQKFPEYFSKPNKDAYVLHADAITNEVHAVVSACSDLPLFDLLYGDVISAYLDKLNTSTAKDLFKISSIEGLLTAYRLFYVGCSRAKSKLDVIVDIQKINDVQSFTQKFEELGFDVVDHK